MKVIVGVLISAFAVLFSSCSSDPKDELVAFSFISTGGMLNVQLENYESEGIDSIKIFDADSLLGKCKPTTDGVVMLQLSKPKLKMIGSVKNVYVSDTTALIKTLTTLNAYNTDKKQIGTISCNNATNYLSGLIGNEIGRLIYCDRNLVIKGSTKETITNSGEVTTDILINDMILKKGWNVFVCKFEMYVDSTGIVRQNTYSTTMPSDLTWKYAPVNVAESVRSQNTTHAAAQFPFSLFHVF